MITKPDRDMRVRRTWGHPLFWIALFIYFGALFLPIALEKGLLPGMRVRQEAMQEQAWTRLELAQVRLQLRAYEVVRYISIQAAATPTAPSKDNYSKSADALLQSVDEGWKKILARDPDNLQLRVALATIQQQLGGPAQKTLAVRSDRLNASEAQTLRDMKELILSSHPDINLLESPQVRNFLEKNPAQNILRASVYERLKRPNEAAREWQRGYRESLPYIAVALMVVLCMWVIFPVIGFVCAFTLFRKKKTDNPEQASPSQSDAATLEPHTDEIGLGAASAVFIVWIILQIFLARFFTPLGEAVISKGGKAVGAIIGAALSAVIAIWFARLKTRRRLPIHWRNISFRLSLRYGLAIFMLVPFVMTISGIVQRILEREAREPSVLIVSEAESLPARLLVLLAACIIVPLTEEAIFRGFLYRGMRSYWGPAAAAIVSSAIFAIGHLDVVSGLPLFLLALGLAWSVEKSGSLAPAVIAHSLFNFFPMVLLNIITWQA